MIGLFLSFFGVGCGNAGCAGGVLAEKGKYVTSYRSQGGYLYPYVREVCMYSSTWENENYFFFLLFFSPSVFLKQLLSDVLER